jgi:hypothetical protein
MQEKETKHCTQREDLGGRIMIQAEIAHTACEPLQADQLRIGSFMQVTSTCLQQCIHHDSLPQ